MGFPWYLKPDWLLHAELLDEQERISATASARARSQDQEIEKLQKRRFRRAAYSVKKQERRICVQYFISCFCRDLKFENNTAEEKSLCICLNM